MFKQIGNTWYWEVSQAKTTFLDACLWGAISDIVTLFFKHCQTSLTGLDLRVVPQQVGSHHHDQVVDGHLVVLGQRLNFAEDFEQGSNVLTVLCR